MLYLEAVICLLLPMKNASGPVARYVSYISETSLGIHVLGAYLHLHGA